MTSDFESTPWWELDPQEKPVPLTPDQSRRVADEAELIVKAEREAIIREDTEPTIVTLAQLAAEAKPRPGRSGISVTRRAVAMAAASLFLGCVITFTLGWQQGRAEVKRRLAADSVGAATFPDALEDSLNDSHFNQTAGKKGGGA